MARDESINYEDNQSPLGGGTSITLGTDYTNIRAFMCGTGGDVDVIMFDDSEVSLKSLIAGVIYPLRIKNFKSSGATVADVIGFY